MTKKLTVYLIRHAQSTANARGEHQGQKIDESLSELGRTQAKKLAQALKGEKVSAIFASDLKRALHTAEEIGNVLGIKVTPDKRLRERNGEDESSEEVSQRCREFIQDIEKHSGTVIIVSHGGANRHLLGVSTGGRKKGFDFSEIEQGNTCINELEFDGKNWEVRRLNDVGHLG